MTPTPEPEAGIAEVAASLSREQRFAIEAAAECKGNQWWTTYGYLIRDSTIAVGGVLTEKGVALGKYLARAQGERDDA